MNDLKEKLVILDNKNKEIEKLKKELVNESGKVFDEFRKDFFETYPEIESFSWNQYTPYFNDGDTCTFSSNTTYIHVNGDELDSCCWYDENTITNWGSYDSKLKQYVGREEIVNEKFDKRKAEAADIILDFLSKFDDEFYLRRFGDHITIIVTAQGVETEDYDHD